MIHRITEQKGFQLVLEASEGLFRRLGVQAIIGGAPANGDTRGEEIARGLLLLPEYYPGQAWVGLGFQDVGVPLLACDVFLMPSLHEPGGISQLEALACGCFVVARATGGLRDTVSSLRIVGGRILGNGILFSDYAAWALYDAMQRCQGFLRSVDEQRLARARDGLMQSVYDWRMPAERYLREIYAIKEIVRPEGAAAAVAQG
jgi:starch synthase